MARRSKIRLKVMADEAMKEKHRQYARSRYARRKAEREERRKLLPALMRPFYMVLLILLFAITSFAQTYVVLVDTNQVALLPPIIKIAWHTNLYVAQEFISVTTNWSMIGPPVDIKDTNGIVTARRMYQVGTLLTNRYQKITFGGVEQMFPVGQTAGPILETKHYDIPPPLPTTPTYAIPPRSTTRDPRRGP